jgi:hypothetical protein
MPTSKAHGSALDVKFGQEKADIRLSQGAQRKGNIALLSALPCVTLYHPASPCITLYRPVSPEKAPLYEKKIHGPGRSRGGKTRGHPELLRNGKRHSHGEDVCRKLNEN